MDKPHTGGCGAEHSGQAVEDSIADVGCPATCWLDPDTITRSLTGWQQRAECGTCGRTLARSDWQALRRAKAAEGAAR